MGDKCQSLHNAPPLPQIPVPLRAAHFWHQRNADAFARPSAVIVLRERASTLAPRSRRRGASPDRRVQLVDSAPPLASGPHTSVHQSQQFNRSGFSGHLGGEETFVRNHPDIRPGEALVCDKKHAGTTFWAQSKFAAGVEQWRQLSDMPLQKRQPTRTRGGLHGHGPVGILTAARMVGFPTSGPPADPYFRSASSTSMRSSLDGHAVPISLPEIGRTRKRERAGPLDIRRFSKNGRGTRPIVSSLARLEGHSLLMAGLTPRSGNEV